MTPRIREVAETIAEEIGGKLDTITLELDNNVSDHGEMGIEEQTVEICLYGISPDRVQDWRMGPATFGINMRSPFGGRCTMYINSCEILSTPATTRRLGAPGSSIFEARLSGRLIHEYLK